jgi:hypothetical protein
MTHRALLRAEHCRALLRLVALCERGRDGDDEDEDEGGGHDDGNSFHRNSSVLEPQSKPDARQIQQKSA